MYINEKVWQIIKVILVFEDFVCDKILPAPETDKGSFSLIFTLPLIWSKVNKYGGYTWSWFFQLNYNY